MLVRPQDYIRFGHMLNALRRGPLPKTAEEAIFETHPALYAALRDAPYRGVAVGEKRSRRLVDGEAAMFWNGASIEQRPFYARMVHTDDYVALAQKTAELPAGLVVDFGAGTCAMGAALRYLGSKHRLAFVERQLLALQTGYEVLRAIGVDALFINADVVASIADPASRKQLGEQLLEYAAGGPITAITRQTLHPHFSPTDYERFFEFLRSDLRATGGLHLELTGFRTPTFNALCTQLGFNVTTRPQFIEAPGDPLRYLETLPIKIEERVEVWPHFVSSYIPSYLRWSA